MPIIFNGTEIPANGDIQYNGTRIDTVIYDGVTVWQRETFVLLELTGHVGFYQGDGYPYSVNRASGYVGPTSNKNQGAIVWFDLTDYQDAARLDPDFTCNMVLNFESSNYVDSVRKILPSSNLIPYLDSGTTNSTSFSSFKNKANSAHGGTVADTKLTIPIQASDMTSYITSNLVTPTGSGRKLLTMGIRCNYNNPVLYDTTNPPKLTFRYKL